MKAYKCDICGGLFAKANKPILPPRPSSTRKLMIAFDGVSLSSADICPNCLKVISDTVRMLSPLEEKNDESETSSSEC